MSDFEQCPVCCKGLLVPLHYTRCTVCDSELAGARELRLNKYAVRQADVQAIITENTDLKATITDFFRLLDTTDETDSGKEFHPVYISCYRAMLTAELSAVLVSMRNLIEQPPEKS